MTNERKIQQCQMTCCIKVNNPGKQVNYPCRWWRPFSLTLRYRGQCLKKQNQACKNSIITSSFPHSNVEILSSRGHPLYIFFFHPWGYHEATGATQVVQQCGNFPKKKVKNTSVGQQFCSMEQMLKMLWPLALDRLPKGPYPDAWNFPYCIF